jgi:predicted deacylase
MSKASVARPAPGKRKYTVYDGDFNDPDESIVGIYLRRVAAQLDLLNDLHCEALELGYSGIARKAGMTTEDLAQNLRHAAIDSAAANLTQARAALHALFSQVTKRPAAPKADA